MEWVAIDDIGCANYHQYDNHGVLCRECGWPLHNNRTLHWHDDETKQRLKDTTFPIPAICGISSCEVQHICELCSEPMNWQYMEFDDIDQTLQKMYSLKDKEGIPSVQAGDGVLWMECPNRHPHGPSPYPGHTAKGFYETAELLMSQDGYDKLEAEEYIKKAIDVYARIGLITGACQLSMKLAMLVLGRAEIEYCTDLLEFASMVNEKHGWGDGKEEVTLTHSVLKGYVVAMVVAQLNKKEEFDAAINQIQLGYKAAKEEGYTNVINAAEYYLPKAQLYWDEFNPNSDE